MHPEAAHAYVAGLVGSMPDPGGPNPTDAPDTPDPPRPDRPQINFVENPKPRIQLNLNTEENSIGSGGLMTPLASPGLSSGADGLVSPKTLKASTPAQNIINLN